MLKNLVLTGMMGVGKTSIGRNLAKKLNFTFVDIDKIIEDEEGSSINAIFKNKSERYFRALENKITLREMNANKKVISLGGGAFLSPSIRQKTEKTSISFWLDVPTKTLIKRLRKSIKRPLLFKKKINETINQIYIEREKTYCEADYRIRCGSLKKEIIARKIIKLYESSKIKV